MENKVQLETERLILRPWKIEDAEALYEYAKDPRIGPSAGWRPHTSIEDSRHSIRTTLSEEGCFAVIPKTESKPVGCIAIRIGSNCDLAQAEDEGEIGYWIGVPFWGRGLIPEATAEIMRYGFEDLGLSKIWCGYFDGNNQSERVQEKCGFIYHHKIDNFYWKELNEIKKCHVTLLTKEMWEQRPKQKETGG